MEEFLSRWWQEILARPGDPLSFRFYLQPIMAVVVAIRDGLKDARADRPAFLWSLLADPARRAESLRSGWRGFGRIFLLAVALDLAYQIFVLKGFRPVQGLVIAVVLAIVPYVLLRGPVNRLARRARGVRPRLERPA